MSIPALIEKYGVTVYRQRASRAVDAVGSTVETWTTEREYKAFVVIRGGYNVSGSGDAQTGGKETRQQNATLYFEGTPDIKFDDRIRVPDPVRTSLTYIFEVRNVVTPEFRLSGDALQYTSVRVEEVRQP